MSPEELLNTQNDTLHNMAQMGPDLSRLLETLTLLEGDDTLSLGFGLWVHLDHLVYAEQLTESFRNFSQALKNAYDSTSTYLHSQKSYFNTLSITSKYIYTGLDRINTQGGNRSQIYQTLLNAFYDCLPFLHAWTPRAEYFDIVDQFVDMQLEQLLILLPELKYAKTCVSNTTTNFGTFGDYVKAERKQIDMKCGKASARMLNSWLSTPEKCNISLLLPEVDSVTSVTNVIHSMKGVLTFMELQLQQMLRSLFEIKSHIKVLQTLRRPQLGGLLEIVGQWEQVGTIAYQEMMAMDDHLKRWAR
ncbi:hypothetical protein BDV97DRAFT_399230 [Delphinella strobiligena]|nr:hypothetical protein BDV97DRAFT_399230 [Delphinella strobiligena]